MNHNIPEVALEYPLYFRSIEQSINDFDSLVPRGNHDLFAELMNDDWRTSISDYNYDIERWQDGLSYLYSEDSGSPTGESIGNSIAIAFLFADCFTDEPVTITDKFIRGAMPDSTPDTVRNQLMDIGRMFLQTRPKTTELFRKYIYRLLEPAVVTNKTTKGLVAASFALTLASIEHERLLAVDFVNEGKAFNALMNQQ